VECKTTHGHLTIDVREHWGPLGAAQYLSLVDQNFFTDLPFFRVAPRYITQFGAKLHATNTARVKTIKDDASLWGKRDMDFGYLFFAGSGVHSRHDQMVLALCEQKGCIQTALGKAAWEVPIGRSYAGWGGVLSVE
jgi:cyclophilin family peptidyl-prolyl cis-trans isomerase